MQLPEVLFQSVRIGFRLVSVTAMHNKWVGYPALNMHLMHEMTHLLGFVLVY